MRADGVTLPDNPTAADLKVMYEDSCDLEYYLASREGTSDSTLAAGEVHSSNHQPDRRRVSDRCSGLTFAAMAATISELRPASALGEDRNERSPGVTDPVR